VQRFLRVDLVFQSPSIAIANSIPDLSLQKVVEQFCYLQLTEQSVQCFKLMQILFGWSGLHIEIPLPVIKQDRVCHIGIHSKQIIEYTAFDII